VTRKLLYASAAVLVSGVLLGCFDAIAPRNPHARSVSLNIVPVFETGSAQSGIPSDVDLIRITLHNPPAADTVLNFPIEPGQDSIIITISNIALNNTGGPDTVGVTFQAIRSSDNTVLYSGTQSYELSVGVPNAGTPLVATYVGPGQNIKSITIAPPSATLKPGDTLAFSFTALDSSNATIVGMPALFDSRNTAIVTVSAAGVAKGVALGSAYVVVTSGARSSVKDSALVTVSTSAPPAIALSPATATFLDTAGTSDPAAQTINVTNGGGGVLSGLSLGTIAYGAGATGWLVANLAASAAPTTLSLSVAKGSIAPGTYTATVPVQSASASNSPQNVSVSFTIVAASSLASITGTPGYAVMKAGDQLTYAVSGKDGSGNTVTPAGVSYASRSPAVASVNAATGVVTAVSSGTAVIVAQAPTATGTTADSTLIVVAANGSPVVAAIGDGRGFDAAAVGGPVTVLVLVDLRAVAGDTLGSYNAQLDWSTAALTYVSSAAVAGGFAAPTVNETNVTSGHLRFGSADPNGSGGAFALIKVNFTAAAAGNSPLTLSLTDLSTAKTFVQLLPVAAIVSGWATIH